MEYHSTKWFHNFSNNNDYLFKDKNKVINGLRCSKLAPDKSCDGLCKGIENCVFNSKDCDFLRKYYEQLNNLNFQEIISELSITSNYFKHYYKMKEDPIIVLIVYENPENKCSERDVIIRWFKENNYNLEELKYPIKYNYST